MPKPLFRAAVLVLEELLKGGIYTEVFLYAEVYAICIVVTAILLVWYILTAGKSTSERWIRYMLTAFLISFSFNFLFNIFSNVLILGAAAKPICYLLKTGFHSFLVIGLFGWCGYADTEAGHQNYARRDKRNPHYIPFIIPIVFLLINLKTHWIFKIDDNLRYERNWMFQTLMIYQIVAACCLSISLIYANRNEQEPHKMRHILVTASFPIAMLVGWSLSFMGEGTPVICVAITIELLCLALGNSNIRISIDKLTNVNNRNNLIGFINYKVKNHSGELYMLMIDINSFKKINDSFGHLVGDYALIRVSKALKDACAPFSKRPYIARFGGDEFIIVLEGTESDLDRLIERINSYVKQQDEETDYSLSVSIGVAKYNSSMSYNDLIESADTELYKIKNGK